MNEMIERVARALCREALKSGALNMILEKGVPAEHLRLKIESGVTQNWSRWINDARIAIAAMREPTKEMFDAVTWTEGVGDGGWTERAPFAEEYQTAIDAALEEYTHTENATPVEAAKISSLPPEIDDITRAAYQRMIDAALK
jgi:hypothetical protein